MSAEQQENGKPCPKHPFKTAYSDEEEEVTKKQPNVSRTSKKELSRKGKLKAKERKKKMPAWSGGDGTIRLPRKRREGTKAITLRA